MVSRARSVLALALALPCCSTSDPEPAPRTDAGSADAADASADASAPEAGDASDGDAQLFIPGPSCLATPQDGFDGASIDLSRWELFGDTAQVSVALDAGALTVSLPATTTDFVSGGLESLDVTDLSQCDAVAELSEAIAGSSESYTVFGVSPPVMHLDYFELYMLVRDSTLTVGRFQGAQDTVYASVPYAASEHRYLRIGVLDEQVHFATSPDGVVWASVASANAGPALGEVVSFLGAGVLGATSQAGQVTRFASANVLP